MPKQDRDFKQNGIFLLTAQSKLPDEASFALRKTSTHGPAKTAVAAGALGLFRGVLKRGLLRNSFRVGNLDLEQDGHWLHRKPGSVGVIQVLKWLS